MAGAARRFLKPIGDRREREIVMTHDRGMLAGVLPLFHTPYKDDQSINWASDVIIYAAQKEKVRA